MEADHAAEELLTSRKHLENARSFMLALLLLVVIAAIHLIWTCVSISSASQALADRQQGSAFLRDEELSLSRYLVNGDPKELTKIEFTQRELRELAAKNSSFEPLVDLEDSWYVNFAQPLIRQRKQMDAGTGTPADLEARYTLLTFEQKWNLDQINASEAKNRSEAERLRRDIDHMVNVRVSIAVFIAIGAMLVALLGLRTVTALRQAETWAADASSHE
jgi:hypothetical protein